MLHRRQPSSFSVQCLIFIIYLFIDCDLNMLIWFVFTIAPDGCSATTTHLMNCWLLDILIRPVSTAVCVEQNYYLLIHNILFLSFLCVAYRRWRYIDHCQWRCMENDRSGFAAMSWFGFKWIGTMWTSALQWSSTAWFVVSGISTSATAANVSSEHARISIEVSQAERERERNKILKWHSHTHFRSIIWWFCVYTNWRHSQTRAQFTHRPSTKFPFDFVVFQIIAIGSWQTE